MMNEPVLYICGCCGDLVYSVEWNEELERDECLNCE